MSKRLAGTYEKACAALNAELKSDNDAIDNEYDEELALLVAFLEAKRTTLYAGYKAKQAALDAKHYAEVASVRLPPRPK